jgi:hypothetical protein
MVQPVPIPSPIKTDNKRNLNEGGSNQNLRFFNRGKAISCLPSKKGINQLPNPPNRTGITKKNIIISP